jgi:hypothetical protein
MRCQKTDSAVGAAPSEKGKVGLFAQDGLHCFNARNLWHRTVDQDHI